MEKRPAATAGLGKYSTGGYGRIGVYRVILLSSYLLYNITSSDHLPNDSVYLIMLMMGSFCLIFRLMILKTISLSFS